MSDNNNLAAVMTVPQVAAYLQVHPSTIYRLVKRGQFPGFKLGSDWRFNREQIDQWRFAQLTAPDAARFP